MIVMYDDNGELKYQCVDCENLGDKIECKGCPNGVAWPCKADKKSQHVHPEMGSCTDFKIRTTPFRVSKIIKIVPSDAEVAHHIIK